jgi:hypothetical protein
LEEGTSQYKALVWLIDEVKVFGNYTTEKQLQLFSLATLYYSTNGDSWNSNTNWLSTLDVCYWYNVDVETCSSDGLVTGLVLRTNSLNGMIPAEIGLLSSSLAKLDLNSNSLIGKLPSEIGLLTKLTWLDLGRNSITGVPWEIVSLTQLSVLNIAAYRDLFFVASSEQADNDVNAEGSPHSHAAEWIMFKDPLGLSPNAPNLIQRYQMALFYFLTTNNGDKPWRSCNPPRGDETDECLYIAHEFDDVGNRPATRWLSGTHECEWTGVFCGCTTCTLFYYGTARASAGRPADFLSSDVSGRKHSPWVLRNAKFNHIIALNVLNQNIRRTLPTEISSMPYLQGIGLYHNEVSAGNIVSCDGL